MDETFILLNLACLKYTGCYLPSNATPVKEWSYETDEFGIRRGKFNPFADTLLTNPFRTAYDTYPIEHKIKRYLINTSILEAFAEPLTCCNLLRVACGVKINLGLTDKEVYDLIETRNNYIRFSEILTDLDKSHYFPNNQYDIINEKKYEKLKIENNKHIFLQTLAGNPKLASVLEKYAKSNTKDKTKRIVRLLKSTDNYTPIRRDDDRGRFNKGDIVGYRRRPNDWITKTPEDRLRLISTQDLIPKLKRSDWIDWFWIYTNYIGYPDRFINIKEVHRRRATNKVNWWGYIKDNSAKLPELPENKKEWGEYKKKQRLDFEKKLVSSIMTL